MSSKLGTNPLSKGIFSKTTSTAPQIQETREKKTERRKKNQDFLRDDAREKVNLQIPVGLNDWLDDLIKAGKRQHGRKIPKQVWLQGALELMQAMPVEWGEIKDEGQLREVLLSLVAKVADKPSLAT